MTITKYLIAGSAIAVASGLIASPASSQEVCITSEDGGGTTAASGTATGLDSLACGAGSLASGSNSVAVGQTATASGPTSTAVGFGTDATANQSIAVGYVAQATGQYSVAIGNDAQATGFNSMAIGHGSRASDYATGIGFSADATGLASTSIGIASEASGHSSTATGYYATALGTRSSAFGRSATATGNYSTVLGARATDAGFDNSVALGVDTAVTADNQVNVGGRTIGGVADGVAANDAATVGQLGAVEDGLQSQITTLETDVAASSAAIADLDLRTTQNEEDIAILYASTAYTDVNSTGAAASATGTDAIAIGEATTATATNSTALGAGASATHENSLALGAGTTTTAANQVNVGGRTVSGLAAGTLSATSSDAVTGAQLFATNQAVSALDTRVDALELAAVAVNADLRRLDRKLAGSTAIAIAMGGSFFLPDKAFNLSGNVATYDGAYAGSLQMGALISPNVALNGGVAKNFNKKGDLGARVGFSFGW